VNPDLSKVDFQQKASGMKELNASANNKQPVCVSNAGMNDIEQLIQANEKAKGIF
jgi:hypothetical protein